MGDTSTTFDRFVGMCFDDKEPGTPRTVHLRLEPHHCNPTGAINGGVILSLAPRGGRGRCRKIRAAMVGSVIAEGTLISGRDVRGIPADLKLAGDRGATALRRSGWR
jgi:hypothetical protein